MKIEGKTLVNIAQNVTHTIVGSDANSWSKRINLNRPLEANKVYTLIFNVESYSLDKGYSIMGRETDTIVQYGLASITRAGVHIFKFTSILNMKYLNIADENNSTSGESVIKDFILLEGDHTDKDISYFEGLKSVGQDTGEISVESVNENLFDGKFTSWWIGNGVVEDATGEPYSVIAQIEPNYEYYIQTYTNCFDRYTYAFLDSDMNTISYVDSSSCMVDANTIKTKVAEHNTKYLFLCLNQFSTRPRINIKHKK